ncbi:PDZ and LIM domain protein 7, partial [Geodia barretti]
MATRTIHLSGGRPWGITLSGGRDFGAPLCVSKVTAGGKAQKGGVNKGDYVISINGDLTDGLLHFDAQQMIKATGMSLQLTLSGTPPKSPSMARANPFTNQDSTDSRPRPPSPPPATSPVSGGNRAKPTASPSSYHTPAPPREDSVKLPYPEGPPVQRSPLSPDSGLDRGSTSTSTYQSPSFRRLHDAPETVPSALGPCPPRPPSPPSEKMRDIRIDDGNTVKTSYKPRPPPTVTSKVTTPPKTSPIPKPAPPPSSTSPSPRSPVPTSPVGNQQMTPAVAAKLTQRQGVCAACSQPIRGPYATAMGRSWHPEHFVCTSCQKQLQNTMFVFEEESIFCENCYAKKFAKTCHSCHKSIVGPCITAQDLSWHQEHFVCSRCRTDLSQGEGF